LKMASVKKYNPITKKSVAHKAIWFTGLPCSGKTTLAIALEKVLTERGIKCYILDGDILRKGLNKNLGFSEADRKENIRRAAEVSKLFMEAGTITLNCFVSPTIEIREMAKNIIGKENFIEVYVNCPLAVCEQRDTKGHYAKARKGELPDFTGVGAVYEPPLHPDIELRTDINSVQECIKNLVDFLFN
jgi:adenylylsulfate kinase